MKNKINPQEVFQSIDQELKLIKEGLDWNQYSKEELNEVKNELKKVEFQAVKAKISIKLQVLSKEEPFLPSKEVVIKILKSLPPKIDESYLPQLTIFIFSRWQQIRGKLAA